MAKLHFVTGKGGVGKTCFSATLAYRLARDSQRPVLLVDVQGNGLGLRLLGSRVPPSYEIHGLPLNSKLWGFRLTPREAFKEYMGHILALGLESSVIGQVTQVVREKVIDAVVANKVVSAFVDVCPGLEPSVILGKIHHEATRGRCNDLDSPWQYVVVDAPATGHSLSLFKSTRALLKIFGSGMIFKQAHRMQADIENPIFFKPWIVSTCEELPLQECREIKRGLKELGLPPPTVVLNRVPKNKTRPDEPFPRETTPLNLDGQTSDKTTEWDKAIDLWIEEVSEKTNLALDFLKGENINDFCWLPEIVSSQGTFDVASAARLIELREVLHE